MTEQQTDELIPALRRIKRKADVMRIDAKGRGEPSVAADAEEIRLLAGIALRAVGAHD